MSSPNTALTKASKTRRIRQILGGGEGLVEHEDARWLLAEIFPNHPRWQAKKGVGIEWVIVKKMPPFNALCFWLVRDDGSQVDISFRESLSPSTHHGKVMSAARCEIEYQISQWKQANPPECDGLHVDHVDPPFETLFKTFLESESVDEGFISVLEQSVGRRDSFENRPFAQRWAEYHRANCVLAWLDASENMRKSNRRIA